MFESTYQEHSFGSLVDHFDVELRKILNGSNVTDILNHNQRGTLRKYGVLSYRTKRLAVDEKALKILKDNETP